VNKQIKAAKISQTGLMNQQIKSIKDNTPIPKIIISKPYLY
jgi:hypothetical protein